MNYYPHHIGDYAQATRHLTMLEHGAYRLLLDVYYSSEQPIPADRKRAYRLVLAQSKQEQEAVDTVLSEFFIASDSGFAHKRCDAEIAKANEKKQKAAQSANNRWKNANALPTHQQNDANAYANALPTQYEGNAPNPNPNPKESQHLPPMAALDASPQEFIWTLGKKLLGEKAGSLIGKARKNLGDEKVTEVLACMSAMSPPVSDPIPYFVKATTPKPRRVAA